MSDNAWKSGSTLAYGADFDQDATRPGKLFYGRSIYKEKLATTRSIPKSPRTRHTTCPEPDSALLDSCSDMRGCPVMKPPMIPIDNSFNPDYYYQAGERMPFTWENPMIYGCAQGRSRPSSPELPGIMFLERRPPSINSFPPRPTIPCYTYKQRESTSQTPNFALIRAQISEQMSIPHIGSVEPDSYEHGPEADHGLGLNYEPEFIKGKGNYEPKVKLNPEGDCDSEVEHNPKADRDLPSRAEGKIANTVSGKKNLFLYDRALQGYLDDDIETNIRCMLEHCPAEDIIELYEKSRLGARIRGMTINHAVRFLKCMMERQGTARHSTDGSKSNGHGIPREQDDGDAKPGGHIKWSV